MALPHNWMLVCRADDDDLRVVSVDGGRTEWRKLSALKELRGAAFKAVRAAIEAAESGDLATAEDFFVDVVSQAEYAVRPAAVLLHSSDQGSPPVGAFRWEFHAFDAPPRLYASDVTLDLIGVPAEHRDRSTYGPADFFSNAEKVADIAAYLDALYDADPGTQGSYDLVVRVGDGRPTRLRIAQQVRLNADRGREVTGVCWHDDSQELGTELLDVVLARNYAIASGQFAAIGDMRFGAIPYTLRWLGDVPDQLAHGMSAGQAYGFHPEDVGRVFESIMKIKTEGTVQVSNIRVRSKTGGWLPFDVVGFRLDPVGAPHIGAVLATPSTDHSAAATPEL